MNHRWGTTIQICALAALASSATTACGSGGRYGYAREYVYAPDEERYARQADSDAIYDEVRRMPDRFNGRMITWFGVVTSAEPAPGGGGLTRVALQQRTHRERHLCEDETEASCRVTVSDQDGGPFTALVRLSTEDTAGENRVQPGGLLRVYGTLVPGEYDAQGGPVVRAQFYRHWPRGQFVTTAAAALWRR
jgi:hypothetical protein